MVDVLYVRFWPWELRVLSVDLSDSSKVVEGEKAFSFANSPKVFFFLPCKCVQLPRFAIRGLQYELLLL